MAEKRKSFTGSSAGEARMFACDWLRNFKDHGPLDLKSIRVSEERDHFVAIVTYAEAVIEQTPQYFPDYQPQMLKSA